MAKKPARSLPAPFAENKEISPLRWRPPEVEFLTPHRLRFDFTERFRQLDPLCHKLESLLAAGQFQRKHVEVILAKATTQRLWDKKKVLADKQEQELDEKVTLIRDLLRKKPPEFVATPLKEWLGDLVMVQGKQEKRKPATFKYKAKSCPLAADIVTALADYFFVHRRLRQHLASKAAVYRIIGSILAEFSSPCPICGAPSHAKGVNYRNVLKLDHRQKERK